MAACGTHIEFEEKLFELLLTREEQIRHILTVLEASEIPMVLKDQTIFMWMKKILG